VPGVAPPGKKLQHVSALQGVGFKPKAVHQAQGG
jgi:hypothetical protein